MSPALREILTLDPDRDFHRITRLSMRQDFPTDSTRALELALFRTYCSPRISGLLVASGEFARDPQQRYDDTDIIISELIENGPDSPTGRVALARMNEIHNRFPSILNEDFVYVLSTFILEPLKWNERYGWRPLHDIEKRAYFNFFRDIGGRMGIRDIPDTLAAITAVSEDYEKKRFRYASSNQAIGEYTRDMMCKWPPECLVRLLRPLIQRGLYAALEPELLPLFGFPPSTRFDRRLLSVVMSLRACAWRLLPKYRRPRLRTAGRHRSYPDGYKIEDLGPPDPS